MCLLDSLHPKLMGSGQELTMDDDEPSSFRRRPAAPSFRGLPQLVLIGMPTLDRLPSLLGPQHPFRPPIAPAAPVLGSSEGPYGGGWADVHETGCLGPCQESSPGVRLSPIGAGGRLIHHHPPIEDGIGRPPGHGVIVG